MNDPRGFSIYASFANASNINFVTMPKILVFVKFYKNRGVRWRILHFVQLDNSTKKCAKLH